MDDDIGFVLKPAKENIRIQLPIRKVETESVFVYCLVVHKFSSSLKDKIEGKRFRSSLSFYEEEDTKSG